MNLCKVTYTKNLESIISTEFIYDMNSFSEYVKFFFKEYGFTWLTQEVVIVDIDAVKYQRYCNSYPLYLDKILRFNRQKSLNQLEL
jgi:hypothetical protein